MRIILILLTLVTIVSFSAQAKRSRTILVYNGTGVCEGCPEDIAVQLRRAGYHVDYANERKVTFEKLKQYDVYIQPGGDDVGVVKKALRSTFSDGVDGVQAIQEYVANGGRFMGICLGGYMADSLLEDDNTENLHLVAVASKPHFDKLEARVEDVIWTGLKNGLNGVGPIYYQAGPEFKVLPPEPRQGFAHVLASYSSNGEPAVVMNSYGKGKAMAVGVHPEATDEWFQDDHLEPQHAANKKNQKIFLELVEKLIMP